MFLLFLPVLHQQISSNQGFGNTAAFQPCAVVQQSYWENWTVEDLHVQEIVIGTLWGGKRKKTAEMWLVNPVFTVWHCLCVCAAVVDLNGRYFGGRVVKACFYNQDKFRILDLGEQFWRLPRPTPSPRLYINPFLNFLSNSELSVCDVHLIVFCSFLSWYVKNLLCRDKIKKKKMSTENVHSTYSA